MDVAVQLPDEYISTTYGIVKKDVQDNISITELCMKGYFEGYTFKKDFYTNMEEYNWSNDQLKDKYGPAFPSKR